MEKSLTLDENIFLLAQKEQINIKYPLLWNKILQKIIFTFIKNNEIEKIRKLLDNDNNFINVKDINFKTPLYNACYNSNFEIATTLLDNGAELDRETFKLCQENEISKRNTAFWNKLVSKNINN